MDFKSYLYSSGLIPAAPVNHGYRNFWIRDGYYIGLCVPELRKIIWDAVIRILDNYRWKLEIHAKQKPEKWFEHIHIRYDPNGNEITNEHWLHNQFDAHGNLIEICLDKNRIDLATLLVDYLYKLDYSKEPSAGAWEDRNSSDAYSLASCIHALQRAKVYIPAKREQIERMVHRGCQRLYARLLPYATSEKTVCLSLLGIIWPFNLGGPYTDEIISLVKTHLMREPFGFIRYDSDKYDGEGFTRTTGTEMPWLLGDCWMSKIEPHNKIWSDRIINAKAHFGCLPEAYAPESMRPNRNTPLLWAEAFAYGI
jgi:GH15 family glucan-1,4-alpha-glucosidase